ncbi:MAG: PepSY-like domain-containing protein [Muribaculaceae bacterium]|nr:PepSY-like domain-containing protein [Muribaculaceae bacterium]
MKNFIAVGIFALVLMMTACSDKPVAVEQLPQPVKAFIQQHFPGQTITYAEKDVELAGSKYDVVLADGTRVDFDTDNVWDKIECTMASPVPTALIPAPIVTHIQTNFPDAMILKIDKDHYGYEVELANGLELKFNKQGVLTEMDD